MISNPFWRGALNLRGAKPLSDQPQVAPYGSGSSVGTNSGDQMAATVPFDDGVAMLGATDVQGAIEALKALIDALP